MSSSSWTSDAFFDEPAPLSLDGGSTSAGHLWHSISPRWGHSMHTMCSYHGMFPARLAHYFIQMYSSPGDLVADPFSGRGTVALQARVEGRRSLSGDLSPLGFVLTAAKSEPPGWHRMEEYIARLQEGYLAKRESRRASAPEDIEMLYHPTTLDQIVYLRNGLLRSVITDWSAEQFVLAGSLAGIMHGSQRRDGSSQFLSIGMPNTFSMSPGYVRRYIDENSLAAPEQDVFERLRDKLARLYLDDPAGVQGKAYNVEASELLNGTLVSPGTVDLVITSPPYLGVVNYGASNWIRLWFAWSRRRRTRWWGRSPFTRCSPGPPTHVPLVRRLHGADTPVRRTCAGPQRGCCCCCWGRRNSRPGCLTSGQTDLGPGGLTNRPETCRSH